MKYLVSIIFMAIMTTSLSAQEKIAFEVSFSEPQAHYADVNMELSEFKDDHIDLKMPVWTPGSYLIREFAKNVEEFKAVNASGSALKAEKINKNTWRVYTQKSKRVTVRYRVYSFEISVRTSFVDDTHAFLSPTGLFLYPAGKIKMPSTVKINPYKTWSKISTGLAKVAGKVNTFNAPDFDVLYDSPIEVGNQDVFEFEASGVNHEVAMYGGGNYNKDVLKREMAKIVEEQTAVFGVNPNKRYVFIVHNFNSGGGGLEHLNSTVLGATRNAYNTEQGLVRFLALVSHEYFHLWNVKRLRPVALGPFDYEAENYSTNLWIAEGFTAYYQDVFITRSGLISPERYLAGLASSITALENQPGNRVQPVSEASFDAWIKQYRPNENSSNSTVSYYSKGAMIALIMDLDIINSTRGSKGLDEVMKEMYNEYYVKKGRGYTDAEFRAMAEKIAGHSFGDFYSAYVNGLETIDYKKYLAFAGFSIVDEAAANAPFLGANSALKDGKVMVTGITRESAAWTGGLNVNDELLAFDGYRINNVPDPRSEVDKFIAGKKVGDKIKVLLNRDGLLKTLDLTLTKNPAYKFRIVEIADPSKAQLAVRERWLKLSE